MNEICRKCDTRCRMGLCNGREGSFKYCFRKCGSVSGLEETITPFNSLHELYEKCKWLDWIVPESLVLSNEPYGTREDNMVLLWGQTKYQIGTNKAHPVGYVTVLTTDGMLQMQYVDELKSLSKKEK